jgi:alkylation response protein AidB-like acyl-CoA dehydrogenase
MDDLRSTGMRMAVTLIELARGDAGMVLACPGQALAGVLVRILGDEAQVERLAAAVADGRTWAFLAVTEPGVGSDATRLGTELRPDGQGGYLLRGTKRYIGNGARGAIGVVLARTGDGPLSLRAALVEPREPAVRARTLDMVGLRGAAISEMVFDDLPVRAEDLLGAHLKPARRGMWGVLRTFNTVRVQVAAMAVGTSIAVYEYVRAQRRRWDSAGLDRLAAATAEIEAARELTYRAAIDIDTDRGRTGLAAMAKLTAVRMARRVSADLPRLLGQGAFLAHPLLEKWWRDIAAFEFMEGTSDIQRLHLAKAMIRKENRDGG